MVTGVEGSVERFVLVIVLAGIVVGLAVRPVNLDAPLVPEQVVAPLANQMWSSISVPMSRWNRATQAENAPDQASISSTESITQ